LEKVGFHLLDKKDPIVKNNQEREEVWEAGIFTNQNKRRPEE